MRVVSYKFVSVTVYYGLEEVGGATYKGVALVCLLDSTSHYRAAPCDNERLDQAARLITM